MNGWMDELQLEAIVSIVGVEGVVVSRFSLGMKEFI